MKNIIVGTAGHIDHGKTALVRALTGIDADRIEEEKRRGITIDLGFAHLQLTPGVRLGFIDVPGHERFVKNMLAGVGGIDMVLFVIAADESIKPQTREHFDICRLLGIPRGIVALNKADLVDAEILALARLEAEEFVAGSFLEGAPIVPVSSTTGLGLDALRQELCRSAEGVEVKDSSRHLRLPIDRVFSMKGFGAVITGTLVSGSVAKEQEVEIHPTGKRARVRGVQVYGSPSGRALAGQRTALNLADVDTDEMARGMMLTEPGLFQSTREVDCLLDLLPSAKPLKHRAPVHFHAGSAEIEAEVRLFDRPALRPGGKAFARLVLRDPALLLPGDRFIIRMFSPVITIGGGVVLDNAGLRYRRRADAAARLKTMAEAGPAERMALLVRESGHGTGRAALLARTGLLAAEIESIAAESRFVTLRQPEFWIMDAEWFRAKTDELTAAVREFHQKNPLLPGLAKQDLRGRSLPNAPLFVLDALLAAARQVVVEGDIVRLATHKLVLKEEEERAIRAIERAFEEAGLAVPALNEVLAKSGVELKRAKSILQILLREKKLVRVTEDLVFHHTAIATLKSLLASRRSQRFEVPAFKEWTGVSRKYAIPLLEFLDRERITRREGAERVVL
ncbi:MAG TPA: selenocysteine-specific translation elongation factor [Bryobacteraceae bacterium]|nr:selenocysteine-specific translation elongation factor [Bryobacteraceae bacterium]